MEGAVRTLREVIGPRAGEIDRDEGALRWALGRLAAEGLLALKRPIEWGGPGVAEDEFRRFQEEVARTSGALAFLQTQHQSAVGMIAGGENEELKASVLPFAHDGGRLIGIGFSQLRRPGPPLLRATETAGGYEFDGHVPWVTGQGFYPEFLAGAQLPDGRAVFAVVPLTDGPGVRTSPPMALAAMGSARTVTVDLDHFPVPADRVAFLKPRGWIVTNDEINIALQGAFAMGCARAGLDVLAENGRKRGNDVLCEVFEALDAELEECRAEAERLRLARDADTVADRLALRAWQISLCTRCAHAAVTSSSGAANVEGHPAGRIWRESLVYTVSAQTTPIMEATLRTLVRA